MGNCISSLIWKHWNKYCDYHNLLSILKRKIRNVLCTLLVIVRCCWIRTAQPEKVMQDEMPLTGEHLQCGGERLHLLLHATETSGKALLALVARGSESRAPDLLLCGWGQRHDVGQSAWQQVIFLGKSSTFTGSARRKMSHVSHGLEQHLRTSHASQKAALCASGSVISGKRQIGNSLSTVGVDVETFHAGLASNSLTYCRQLSMW